MGRTTGPDEAPNRSKKGERGRGPRSTQSRTVMISKALSRLLRHQAVNEGVPITSDGWVRLDHLLAWKGLSSRNGVNPPPTVEEIWEVVEENEKKRFAVRFVGKDAKVGAEGNATGMKKNLMQSVQTAKAVNEKAKTMGLERTTVHAIDAGAETEEQPSTTVGELTDVEKEQEDGAAQEHAPAETSAPSETQADTETARAIAHYHDTQPAPPASEFQIRATQGHSIQTVASDTSLLTPVTLDDPSSIPDTCVHGTFYGAWPLILRSGGLKRMGRNHVHFASGPSLADIGLTDQAQQGIEVGKSDKVISGMRSDAQLLIYIDLKRCLEDVKEAKADMLWWKSENGVLLTEGIDPSPINQHEDMDLPNAPNNTAAPTASQQEGQGSASASPVEATERLAQVGVKEQGGRHKAPKSKSAQAQAQTDKLVPMKYWSVVVDIKGGHGIIWRHGEGTFKELPESLTSRGTPKDRGRGRGRGRGR